MTVQNYFWNNFFKTCYWIGGSNHIGTIKMSIGAIDWDIETYNLGKVNTIKHWKCFVFSGSRNYRKNSESELSLNSDARSPAYSPVTKSIENCPSSPEYIPVTENLGTIHILRRHFYSTKLNLTSEVFTKTEFFSSNWVPIIRTVWFFFWLNQL